MKLKYTLPLSAVCATALITSSLNAEEESPWAFSVSLDANSQFMSYGVNVWGTETEDIGDEILFEPTLSASYDFSDAQGIYVGAWFDINGVEDAGHGDVGPDLGGDTKEMDLWIGYWFSVADFTFDFTLQSWKYAGENEGIFDITISYDTLFSPYLIIHNRFEDVAGQEKGTIFELGGTLYENSYAGIDYSFSAGMGFSIDDYHVAGEEGYAYSFLGLSASYVFYSTDDLDVDVHGALTYYDTDEDATGNDESSYLTANLGVGFSF
jgi:hypothetical protein